MLPDQFMCIIQLLVEEDSVTTPSINILGSVKPFFYLKRLARVRALYARFGFQRLLMHSSLKHLTT